MPSLRVICTACGKRSRFNRLEGEAPPACLACGGETEIDAEAAELEQPAVEERPIRTAGRARVAHRRRVSRKPRRFAGSPLWAWAIFCFGVGALSGSSVIAAVWLNQPPQVVVVKEPAPEKETPVRSEDNQPAQPVAPEVHGNPPIPGGNPLANQQTVPAPAIVFRPLPDTFAENGWPLYVKPADGFALALPPDWREVDMTPEMYKAGMQEILRINPQLKGIAGSPESGSTPLKFYGIDEPASRFQSTALINVSSVQAPDWTTLEDVEKEIVEVWRKVPGVVQPIEHSIVAKEKGSYVRVRFAMGMMDATGRTQRVSITQLYHLAEKKLYTVNLAVATGRLTRYSKSFETIENSFRLITPLDLD